MKPCAITDHAGTEAVILPEKGATVVSLKYHGHEYLYRDLENLLSDERPRCGIPFLFPVYGKDTLEWNGNAYCMGIHGFAHTSCWAIESHTEDTLVLTLQATADTLNQYPFPFHIKLVFSVASGTLSISQVYRNIGDTPMPFQYGFHPYFCTEESPYTILDMKAKKYIRHAAQSVQQPVSGEFAIPTPEERTPNGITFLSATPPATLRGAEGQRSVTLHFGADYQTLVLWARPEKPFLCLEPICGNVGDLNSRDYQVLVPGEVRSSVVTISVS